jgi:WD40 repeat protein
VRQLAERKRYDIVAFSSDGRLVTSASADKTVQLWDAATGAERRVLQGHSDWVWAVAFSPDGQLVASASCDKIIRLRDATTGVKQRVLQGHSDWVKAITFSPDRRLVVSVSGDKTVRLWDATTGTLYFQIRVLYCCPRTEKERSRLTLDRFLE